MRYIPENNLLFLHIPKTGGVAIEKAVNNNWKKRGAVRKIRHRWNGIPGRHVRRNDLECFPWEKDAWAFCFVRHPLDWYMSCWRHLHAMQKRRIRRGSDLADMFHWYHWHPQKWLASILSPDFDKWIERIITQDPGHLSKLYEEYIGLDRDVPHVQYVGRQETLTQDVCQLLKVSEVSKVNITHGLVPSASKQSIEGIMNTEEQILQRYYGSETVGFRRIEDWSK